MTSSKEERLRKVAETIDPHDFKGHASMVAYCLRAGDPEEDARRFADDTYGKNMAEALTKAAAIEAEYAEEIGRLRAGLEAAEKALQIIAWEGAESASSKQILAACRDTAREALALSTVVGGDSSSKEEVNTSSVAESASRPPILAAKTDSGAGH